MGSRSGGEPDWRQGRLAGGLRRRSDSILPAIAAHAAFNAAMNAWIFARLWPA